jgi:F0F1-type ATP synthase membrane subunit b/b'
MENLIRTQVQESIASQFKDKRLVDIETSQAVLERVQGWAKLFSYFVGIPLGLFLLWLGFMGFEKYTDFTALVKNAETQVKPRLEQAKASADEANRQAEEAKRSAQEAKTTINSELKSSSQVGKKVEQLSAEFSELEKRTSAQLQAAGKQVDTNVATLNKKIDSAAANIAEQEKKLASTNELVKGLFAARKTDYLDTKAGSTNCIAVPLGKQYFVVLLLSAHPIPESIELKSHVASQPRNSYGIITNNIVYFVWADALQTLQAYPLEVAYVADKSVATPLFKTLSYRDGVVYADSTVVQDFSNILKQQEAQPPK